MVDHIYEVIIIGAGVEGSCTGYYLTSRCTSNVLLLEQFDRGHAQGSSHGGSRITRKAFLSTKQFYFKMMDEVFKLWEEIEKEAETQLYNETGVLVFGDDSIQPYIDSMKVNNVPHQVMSGREANERYPQQLKLPEDYLCALEHEAGILRASKAVAVIQDLFVRQGGHFRDNHKVTGLIPEPIVTVQTDKGDFRAKRVVITSTAGAWTNKLLQPTGLTLPLEVWQTEVLYWKTRNPSDFSYDRFPTFLVKTRENQIYGVPVFEYPELLKVCDHYGSEVDPDKRDANQCSFTHEGVSQFIQKHFKGVGSTVSMVEPCMHTNTPDIDPVLDRHPSHPNIVIGAGFSGHGFRLGPIVGKLLSQLALEQPTTYDLAPFRIGRFD